MKTKNDWMLGCHAALKAVKSADLDERFQKAPKGTSFKDFRAGWHSVWACERRNEIG